MWQRHCACTDAAKPVVHKGADTLKKSTSSAIWSQYWRPCQHAIRLSYPACWCGQTETHPHYRGAESEAQTTVELTQCQEDQSSPQATASCTLAGHHLCIAEKPVAPSRGSRCMVAVVDRGHSVYDTPGGQLVPGCCKKYSLHAFSVGHFRKGKILSIRLH